MARPVTVMVRFVSAVVKRRGRARVMVRVLPVPVTVKASEARAAPFTVTPMVPPPARVTPSADSRVKVTVLTPEPFSTTLSRSTAKVPVVTYGA